ncbi:MAG: hypothetical protein LBT02_03685 [Rickettsiales bacterium]|jgi:hypothetical protein|nr:hypothetical protein [Rickettsiales bacterium]
MKDTKNKSLNDFFNKGLEERNNTTPNTKEYFTSYNANEINFALTRQMSPPQQAQLCYIWQICKNCKQTTIYQYYSWNSVYRTMEFRHRRKDRNVFSS